MFAPVVRGESSSLSCMGEEACGCAEAEEAPRRLAAMAYYMPPTPVEDDVFERFSPQNSDCAAREEAPPEPPREEKFDFEFTYDEHQACCILS